MSNTPPAPEQDDAAQTEPQVEALETEETEEAEENNLPANEVAVEEIATLKKKVTITIAEEKVVAKRDEMFGELGDTAQIPGFRVGRAPRRLLEKRFGKDVSQDVRNSLVGESIGEAIEEADLKTLGEPDLKLDDIVLPEAGDLEFSFEVEVQPEFQVPSTEGMEVELVKLAVDDAKIDAQLDNIREGQARYEKTEGAAGEGDGVVAAAKITGEEIAFETPRVEVRVAPSVVEGIALPKIGDDLAGKKVGDVVTIKATVTDTHPNEDWRGKDVEVELTIHEVSQRVLPTLDDAWATEAGFDSVGDLRDHVGEQLSQRLEMDQQKNLRDQVCEKMLAAADFALPEDFLKRHTAQAVQRKAVELMQYGIPQEKIQELLAELQASAEEETRKNLRLSFILGKIAEEKDIDVDESEVNARIAQMAAQYRRRPERLRQELTADGSLEQVRVSLVEEKALDSILGDVKVTEVDAPAEEEKKPAAKKAAKKKTAKKAAKKTVKKAAKKPAKKTEE